MNVECHGNETNIDQCEFEYKMPSSPCTHANDVVVECYGGAPTGNATTPEACLVKQLQETLNEERAEWRRIINQQAQDREEWRRQLDHFRQCKVS